MAGGRRSETEDALETGGRGRLQLEIAGLHRADAVAHHLEGVDVCRVLHVRIAAVDGAEVDIRAGFSSLVYRDRPVAVGDVQDVLPVGSGLRQRAVGFLVSGKRRGAFTGTDLAGGAGGILVGIAAFCLCIYLLILYMRLFFMLPAKSLGIKMSFKEAIAASRGLLLRWVGAGLIFGIVAGLPYLIYIFVMSFLVLGMTAQTSLMESVGLYVLVAVPAIFSGLLSAAYNAVILSRLYQWGVQGRGSQL